MISEIADIRRRTKNIPIIIGELIVATSFSPISKYDRVKRKKVMVEAKAKHLLYLFYLFLVKMKKVFW